MKDSKGKILIIPLEKILPNRFQPRIKFSEESILNLSDSIKEHGVLQPIIVRPIADKYEIIAGERRYKATVLAGLKEIPALLVDVNDMASAEVALIENVQRKDLSPIEEAISYKKILDMGYLTQADLAKKIGVSQSAVANKIRLLNLSDDVQEALLDEKISERHARSLLKITDFEEQVEMLKRVIKRKLTVRALDEEIKHYKENNKFKEIDENNKISESTSEPKIQIKNEIKEEKKLTPRESVEKIKNELMEESCNESKEELEEDLKDKIIKDKENSIFESITKVEEIKPKEENDKKMNNNFQNVNNDINYNTLKSSNGNKGKFFMNVEDEQPEKKEDSNFNFEKSNPTPNIFTDLMAPQGSNNLFNSSSTQESVIPSQPVHNEKKEEKTSEPNVSSMFENLMGVSTTSTEEIDKESFDKFMDPAFVDGKKQEVSENENDVDSNVFSKFIPNNEQENKNVEDNINNNEKNNSIFNNFFNKFQNKITNKNTQSVPLTNSSIFDSITPIDETKNVSNNQLTNLNNDSRTDIFSKLSNESEKKPDLLAPMDNNSETKNSTTIFDLLKSNEDVKNQELVNDKPEIVEISNEESVVNESNSEPVIPSVEIPIRDNIEEKSKELEKLPEEDVKIENNLEEVNNNDVINKDADLEGELSLTPDLTVSDSEEVKLEIKESETQDKTESKLESNEEEKVDESVDNNEESNSEEIEEYVSFDNSKPIFVTASSSENLTQMPTSPIIDVKDDSTDDEEIVEIPEQAPVVTNLEAEEDEVEEKNDSGKNDSGINNMIGNQPIIVTDYNKQYDPVIPTEKPVEKIDFKKIIGLIRELSETIEKCGYEIDTDEIDLQDKYQVIFNINKQ